MAVRASSWSARFARRSRCRDAAPHAEKDDVWAGADRGCAGLLPRPPRIRPAPYFRLEIGASTRGARATLTGLTQPFRLPRNATLALFWGGLLLLIAAAWRRDDLPPADALEASLRRDPDQLATEAAPFRTTVGDVAYTVTPRNRYDLTGLVVSMHDTGAWWDSAHVQWNDKLNITDLCVIWGKNAATGAYARAAFSSSQYTCTWAYGANGAEAPFDPFSISNNHLLTTDAAIASAIRGVRAGDQVHFGGYLAEYEHDSGFHFHRGTSTVRTDTGDHACETVFVDRFEVLRAGGGPWRALFWCAVAMLIAGVVGWFAAKPKIVN